MKIDSVYTKDMIQSFAHLHIHSEFSLLDGTARIKALVAAAAEVGMPALALTDMANLYATVKFYRACVAKGIKPVLGADVWLDNPDNPNQPDRVVLLCRTQHGYRSLCELLSDAYARPRQSGRPCIDPKKLIVHADGFIVLSGAQESELGRAITNGNTDRATQLAQFWMENFGDRFYLELSRIGQEGETRYLAAALALSGALEIPVVASNQVHFILQSDFPAHEVRVCINEGRVLDDKRRPRFHTEQQYFRSPEEMQTLFADVPQALENTLEIAKRCNVTLSFNKTYLPNFPIADGSTADAQLVIDSNNGLHRYLQTRPALATDEYQKRLEFELDVINKMGFAGYFLIVADFIKWSRENDIPVGPGRGSGAGSIVAFVVGITALDPIEHELLFERFLNPERVSMPDFDIDFCMQGRDRIIDYVTQQYGNDKVSQIITFGTLAAKAVIKDVGRVMGLGYGFVDVVAKLIPFIPGMTLAKAFAEEPQLQERYDAEEEVKQLIDTARQLEGIAKNVGRHAGGVVIAPSALTDYTALYNEPGMSQAITQFDKDDLEAIGLVKFDFLGLRTLTVVDKAIKRINKQRAVTQEPAFDLKQIPERDEDTFTLIKSGKTTALFQLESRGMQDLIQRLQPDRFDDLVALVALFRPGPLQSGMVDDFIKRKHGRAVVEYPHPDVEAILKPTYGVILYQEQVMQIAQVLSGYTLGAADLLRRAMGKKKPDEMAKQRQIFIDGASARKVNKATSTYIFDLMEKFAGYGFNKSHSAAYAMITYQTAWLKTHHPAAFMAAALSSDMDSTDKVVTLIAECREQKIEILPPDVNGCEYEFVPTLQRQIYYGLGAIKGLGQTAIEAVLEERATNGSYQDIFDFCRRIDDKRVNKRALEALISAGAMDSFGHHRAELLANLPTAMNAASQQYSNKRSGQNDMFGVSKTVNVETAIKSVTEWTEAQRLTAEKETLGLYLTGHPIAAYQEELKQIIDSDLASLNPSADKTVLVAGLVVTMRTVNTRRGDRMAFVTLDDSTGRIDISVFGDLYTAQRDAIKKDKLLVVRGAVSVDEFTGGYSMRAETVFELNQLRPKASQVIVTLKQSEICADAITQLYQSMKTAKGEVPLVIEYERDDGIKTRLRLDKSVGAINPCEKFMQSLFAVAGPDNVNLIYSRMNFMAADGESERPQRRW